MKQALATALVVVALGVVAVGIVDVSTGDGSTRPPRLAYVTGTSTTAPQVWVANLHDGARRRVGPGQAPLLSPEGSVLAASAPGQSGPALTLYTIGGTVIRRFYDAALLSAVAQAWSPDARYLAVALTSRNPASAAASGLAVIDTKTLSTSMLARGQLYGASFAPDGSDRIAYAVAGSPALDAPVDIHVAAPDGPRAQQLTHDGRSLYPVWGAGAIAYDRERLRQSAAPAYEVWLMKSDGTQPTQLIHMPVPPLMDGLVPLAFSGDDDAWLLAQFEGLNTSRAWAIAVGARRAHPLELSGARAGVTAAATSRSGDVALVERGGFLRPPSQGSIEELPLSGGRAVQLIAHGSEPSWNQ
jgi:hypothetical protein